MKKFINSYKFPLLLLSSVILGSLVGLFFKSSVVYLKPFGEIFLNMMYTVVVPLVFFTISSSIANMINLKRLGKILYTVFFVFFIMSAVAAIYMIVVTYIFNPVNASISLESGTSETVNLSDQIVKALTVTDFNLILSRSNMLPLIVFSILFGIATSLTKSNTVKKFLDEASNINMKIVKIIMYYAPIGLFSYFASLTSSYGSELLGSYAKAMIIYYLATIVFFFVFYTIYAYIAGGKKGIRSFYRNQMEVTLTSLATQSSLASLPSNLEVTEKMGVPKDIREVTLPIGTTMHMDGSSMGSILKIVFLFSIFNYDFSGLSTILIAILIAIMSSVVMSGIPGGGLIGEMLIVSLYGFPASAFPIIATIGWLIDPPATMLNVVGDTTSSMVVTRIIDGKNWIK